MTPTSPNPPLPIMSNFYRRLTSERAARDWRVHVALALFIALLLGGGTWYLTRGLESTWAHVLRVLVPAGPLMAMAVHFQTMHRMGFGKKVEIEIDVSSETENYLRKLSEERGISLDELVEELLKDYLDELEKAEKNESAVSRAEACSGESRD